MGFRQAAGTKPTQLTSPIPDKNMPNATDFTSGLKPQQAPPMQGGQDAPAQPQESPPQQAAPSQVNVDDPFGHLPPVNIDDPFASIAPAAVAAQEPIDHTKSMAGTDVEGSLLGFHVKVDKEGNVTTSLPMQKGYSKPNAAQTELAKMMYSTLVNGGSTAGSIVGEAAGAGAGLLTGGVGSIPLAMAGGAAGGALGSQANQQIVDMMKAHPDSAKMLYLLQKMSGHDQEDASMGAGMSALVGGLAPAAGALMGGLAKRVGSKMAAQGITDIAGSEMASPVLGKVADASARTGVDISAAEAMNNNLVAGGEQAASAIGDLKSGVFGKDALQSYNTKAVQKQDQLKAFLQGIVQNVAPGMNYENPSELAIAQSAKKGFKQEGLIDTVLNRAGKQIGDYQAEATKLSGDKLHNIDDLISKGAEIARSAGADEMATAMEQGNIVKASEIYKNQHTSNRDLKGVLDAVAQLKSSKTSQGVQASLVNGGTPTEGVTYNYLNNFVNTIQGQGKEGNKYLMQLAGAARENQGNALQSIFANNPQKASEIATLNKSFSDSYEPLQELKKAITSGQSNLGGAVLSWDAKTVKALTNIGLSADELAQFRGATLNAAINDHILLDPYAPVNASSIGKLILSSDKSEALTALVGTETVKDLKAAFTMASFLDKPNISNVQAEDISGKLAKQASKLNTVMGGWNMVKTIYRKIVPDEKAMALIESKVGDYEKFYASKEASMARIAKGDSLKSSADLIGSRTTKAVQSSPLLMKYLDGKDANK